MQYLPLSLFLESQPDKHTHTHPTPSKQKTPARYLEARSCAWREESRHFALFWYPLPGHLLVHARAWTLG